MNETEKILYCLQEMVHEMRRIAELLEFGLELEEQPALEYTAEDVLRRRQNDKE